MIGTLQVLGTVRNLWIFTLFLLLPQWIGVGVLAFADGQFNCRSGRTSHRNNSSPGWSAVRHCCREEGRFDADSDRNYAGCLSSLFTELGNQPSGEGVRRAARQLSAPSEQRGLLTRWASELNGFSSSGATRTCMIDSYYGGLNEQNARNQATLICQGLESYRSLSRGACDQILQQLRQMPDPHHPVQASQTDEISQAWAAIESDPALKNAYTQLVDSTVKTQIASQISQLMAERSASQTCALPAQNLRESAPVVETPALPEGDFCQGANAPACEDCTGVQSQNVGGSGLSEDQLLSRVAGFAARKLLSQYLHGVLTDPQIGTCSGSRATQVRALMRRDVAQTQSLYYGSTFPHPDNLGAFASCIGRLSGSRAKSLDQIVSEVDRARGGLCQARQSGVAHSTGNQCPQVQESQFTRDSESFGTVRTNDHSGSPMEAYQKNLKARADLIHQTRLSLRRLILQPPQEVRGILNLSGMTPQVLNDMLNRLVSMDQNLRSPLGRTLSLEGGDDFFYFYCSPRNNNGYPLAYLWPGCVDAPGEHGMAQNRRATVKALLTLVRERAERLRRIEREIIEATPELGGRNENERAEGSEPWRRIVNAQTAVEKSRVLSDIIARNRRDQLESLTQACENPSEFGRMLVSTFPDLVREYLETQNGQPYVRGICQIKRNLVARDRRDTMVGLFSVALSAGAFLASGGTLGPVLALAATGLDVATIVGSSLPRYRVVRDGRDYAQSLHSSCGLSYAQMRERRENATQELWLTALDIASLPLTAAAGLSEFNDLLDGLRGVSRGSELGLDAARLRRIRDLRNTARAESLVSQHAADIVTATIELPSSLNVSLRSDAAFAEAWREGLTALGGNNRTNSDLMAQSVEWATQISGQGSRSQGLRHALQVGPDVQLRPQEIAMLAEIRAQMRKLNPGLLDDAIESEVLRRLSISRERAIARGTCSVAGVAR